MKKNTLIVLVIVVAVIGAGAYFFLSSQADAPASQVTGEPAVTIVRTPTGYEPSEVTIKKGDIILWTNESGEFHWPASDLHPTHGIYPEFDPLVPIAPGDEWKFKFDEVGVWKFHDHIRANEVGTVTVTE
jgi:plastocyanin